MNDFNATLNTTSRELVEAFETELRSDAKSAVHALAAQAERLDLRIDEFAIIRAHVRYVECPRGH